MGETLSQYVESSTETFLAYCPAILLIVGSASCCHCNGVIGVCIVYFLEGRSAAHCANIARNNHGTMTSVRFSSLSSWMPFCICSDFCLFTAFKMCSEEVTQELLPTIFHVTIPGPAILWTDSAAHAEEVEDPSPSLPSVKGSSVAPVTISSLSSSIRISPPSSFW